MIFAADFKSHIWFSPSRQIFSLLAIKFFTILTNLTVKFKISFRAWSFLGLQLAVEFNVEFNGQILQNRNK